MHGGHGTPAGFMDPNTSITLTTLADEQGVAILAFAQEEAANCRTDRATQF